MAGKRSKNKCHMLIRYRVKGGQKSMGCCGPESVDRERGLRDSDRMEERQKEKDN